MKIRLYHTTEKLKSVTIDGLLMILSYSSWKTSLFLLLRLVQLENIAF